jgi:hypothetical protein
MLIYIIISPFTTKFLSKAMISSIFCAISQHNARPLCTGRTIQFITVKGLKFSTDVNALPKIHGKGMNTVGYITGSSQTKPQY